MTTFPFSRSPLGLLSLLIIVVFALRTFVDVLSDSFWFVKIRPAFDGDGGQISMLTLNIWFSPLDMRKRMEAIGEIVHGMKPNILTFQEVTANHLALLQKQSWFRSYNLIPPKEKVVGSNSVIVLSSYDITSWKIHPFKNSEMERKLLTTELKVTDLGLPNLTSFVVATSHLESLARSSKKREQQFKESIRILSNYDNVCFMGDMNIEAKIDGQAILPPSWVDAWLTHPQSMHDNGFTWNPSKNSYIKKPSQKERFDRIFCKLADFKVKKMKVIGMQSRLGVPPSDHFGLFAVLEPLKGSNPKPKHKEKTDLLAQVYFQRPPGWEKLI